MSQESFCGSNLEDATTRFDISRSLLAFPCCVKLCCVPSPLSGIYPKGFGDGGGGGFRKRGLWGLACVGWDATSASK